MMITLIPREVDEFLVSLGAFEEGDAEAFEEYARKSANLLWGKYVLFPYTSIPIHTDTESNM